MSRKIEIPFNPVAPATILPSSPLAEAELGENGKTNFNVDAPTFRKKINNMKQTLRDMRRLDKWLSAKGGKATLPGGIVFGQAQMKTIYADYGKELENRGKEFTESVRQAGKKPAKKSTNGGTQLKKLYYISDSLVEFLANANYGNGLALALVGLGVPIEELRKNGAVDQSTVTGYTDLDIANAQDNLQKNLDLYAETQTKKKKRVDNPIQSRQADFDLSQANVNAQLRLITENRMANGNIILSAIFLIYAANELYSRTVGSYVHLEGDLAELFTQRNTRWVLGGNDLNAQLGITEPEVDKVSGSGPDKLTRAMSYVGERVPGIKDVKKFTYEIMDTDKTVLTRIQEHTSEGLEVGHMYTNEKRGTIAPTYIDVSEAHEGDAWGFHLMMTMVWANFYRIKNELITDRALIDDLSDPANVAEGARIQALLSELVFAHTLANESRKKADNKVKNAAKRAIKKANSPPKM